MGAPGPGPFAGAHGCSRPADDERGKQPCRSQYGVRVPTVCPTGAVNLYVTATKRCCPEQSRQTDIRIPVDNHRLVVRPARTMRPQLGGIRPVGVRLGGGEGCEDMFCQLGPRESRSSALPDRRAEG